MNSKADPKRNSRVLGIVALCILAVCVTGARFTLAAQPKDKAIGIDGKTTNHTTNSTIVTNVVNTTTVSSTSFAVPTALPVVTNVPVNNSLPAGMTSYVDSSLPFSLAYPSDWTPESSSTSGISTFRVTSSDQNAMVVVGAAPSAYLDANGLQSQLTSNVTSFLTSAGFTLDGTPQYSSATVSGSPAEVAAVAVETPNGTVGGIQAAVVYYQQHLYFVVGVLEDASSANATDQTSQIRTVMNDFALK